MSKETEAKEAQKITTVALPESLVDALGLVAASEHRSRNMQIVLFLREAVSRWDTEHGALQTAAA